MMEKLNDLTQERKRSHLTWQRHNSKVYQKFLELEEAAYANGSLTTATKLLIGIGISIVRDCHACLQWHIEEAAKLNIDQREILEAIEVGIKMGGAPAVVSSRFALAVMDEVYHPDPGGNE